jgi:hypothetical protein
VPAIGARQLCRRGSRIVSVAVVVVLGGCVFYTRTTPEEVRQAILAAGIIGSAPDDAVARLQRIRLTSGQTLLVDAFEPRRKIVAATVRDAKRTISFRWSVNVVVGFDSTRHASTVDVYYSADNAL